METAIPAGCPLPVEHGGSILANLVAQQLRLPAGILRTHFRLTHEIGSMLGGARTLYDEDIALYLDEDDEQR